MASRITRRTRTGKAVLTALVALGLAATLSAAPASGSDVEADPAGTPARELEARHAVLEGDIVSPRRFRGPVVKSVRGKQRTLILPVHWQAAPPPMPDFAGAVAAVDQWYRTVSFGRAKYVAPSVHDWIRVDPPAGDCSDAYRGLLKQAVRGAKLKARKARRFDHIVIYADCVSSKSDGMGETPGRFMWAFGGTGIDLETLAHEFAHNHGIAHANALECGAAVFGRCQLVDYGDPWDMMGGAEVAANLSAVFRAEFGWFPKKYRKKVRRSATVTLAPLGTGAGKQAIVVQTRRKTYWIEHRPQVGLDAWIPGGGVQIRVSKGRALGLVDTTPESNGAWRVPSAYYSPDSQDATLVPGASVTTPEGVVITTVAADAASATVQVTFPEKKKKKKGKKKRRR